MQLKKTERLNWHCGRTLGNPHAAALFVLASMALAMALAGPAQGQSVARQQASPPIAAQATESQAPPAWLLPFQWTNPETAANPGQQSQTPQQQPASQPLDSQPLSVAKGKEKKKQPFWASPFGWANDDEAAADQQVQQAAAYQELSAEKRQPIVNPRAGSYSKLKKIRPTEPVQRQLATQQLATSEPSESRWYNPLSWSNPPTETSRSAVLPAAAYAGTAPADPRANPHFVPAQPPGRVWKSPLYASDAPELATNQPDFEGQKEFYVANAVKTAFAFENERDKKVDYFDRDSDRLPPNATEAQIAEYEKNKFPWVRPFYATNQTDDGSAFKVWPEEEYPGPPLDIENSAVMRPFHWSNAPTQTRLVRRTAPNGTRLAAYLQNEEGLLPQPIDRDDESTGAVPPIGVPGMLDEQGRPAGDVPTEGEGAIAEAETLGREPVDNSLQFLRADTVLLDPGQAQFDYGLVYTYVDQIIPAFVDDPMSMTTELFLVRFRQRELVSPFEVRYGLTRKVQMFAHLPVGWANTEFAFRAFEDFENDGGIGDLTFGSTILLRQGDNKCSDVILTLAATAPTGNDPFPILNAVTPAGPGLGQGVWSLGANLLWVQSYDPVVLFYGFGTRQSFSADVNGIEFQPGQQWNYRMGVGFAVNDKVTFSTRFNGAYISETKLDNERIQGTIQEPMVVELALTISKDKKLIEPFVDFGLTDDSLDARFGITWTK